MCDHGQRVFRIKGRQDLKGTPLMPDNCHIYYIHQDGSIFCEPDVPFNLREEYRPCGEDRLTLVQLPAGQIFSTTETSKCELPRVSENAWSDSFPSPTMPSVFDERLGKICRHCHLKGGTAWRNIYRPDPHFNTSFRFTDEPGSRENGCFLNLYTMRVPLRARIAVAVSIIHHIRVEGGKFVSVNGTEGENKEQIFGFVAGFQSMDIGMLFTNLISQWQDSVNNDLMTCPGMTPKLFMAATIFQYNSIVIQDIISAGQMLKACDSNVQEALDKQGRKRSGLYEVRRAETHAINESLIFMNERINGTGSVLQFLANGIDALAGSVSRFKEYMEACVQIWDGCPHHQDLLRAMGRLDSAHELARDTNQIEQVARSIGHCQGEAQNLLQHINISFGIVRDMSDEIDRSIQISILKNTARDGSYMKILAILTALFLPGTFMAIVLTTPMFNWVDTEKSTLVKVPFEIWMGFSGSMTVLLIIGLALMSFVDWPRIFHGRAASFYFE